MRNQSIEFTYIIFLDTHTHTHTQEVQHKGRRQMTMDIHCEGYVCVGFIDTGTVLQLELDSPFLCIDDDSFELLLVALRKRFAGLPM